MSSSRPAKSHSRTSRPHMSRRATSQHSVPYLPNGPEELILPGGTVGEEAVDLLHDFVHPGHHHDADATMVDGDEEDELPEDEVDARERAKLLDKPWWKRPSPWWFLILSPLSTIAVGATIAPRVEILTMLACDQLKPEYTAGHGMEDLGIRPWVLSGPAASSTSALTTQEQYQHENLVRVQFENTNGTMPQPPPNSKLCKTDPVVQRGVAKLQATMTTTMGILGVLTIGWWGSMSDRYGRTLIVGITILGRIFEDFNFIFVSMFAKRLPGGYWFLLLGPIIEGLMGGIAAASAAIHAYVADCRDPSERSRAFSYLMGAFFIGIALGPTVGGQLVKYSGNILSVYYLAFGVHVLYAVVLWTVLPESRSKVQMATSRRKYNLECAELAAKERSWFTRTATNVTWFARPLAIFIPKRVESATSPGKLGKRDLGLLQVASSQWALTMTLGGIGFKLQYALARFGWTSVEVGYWLTTVGVTRVFHLAVILPLTFRFFKPRAPAIQLPVQDDEPLEGSSSSTAAAPQSSSAGPSKRRHAPHHKANMSFDLGLARISLIFDLVSYILMALAPTGLLFLGGSVLASLGGGFSPAAQALTLELFARQPGRSAAQAGTLFGAMSVAQALCSQVIGPAVFGSLYSVTVGVLPQSIFMLSAGLVTFSLVMMTVLRLPKDEVDEEAVRMGVEREETVVGVEEDNQNKVVGVAHGE